MIEAVTPASDPVQERLNALRDLLPEIFSDGVLDPSRLSDLVAPEDRDRGRYGISWPGREDAVRALRAPATGALKPDLQASVDFEEAEHVLIEGENLEVLKLLYRPYFGRVSMIYIDPPYNTGSDLVYADDFRESLGQYLRLIGQADEQGNRLTNKTNKSGARHSNWLSMMYPRLSLARQMLTETGVIAVSIDDHEVHTLRMLMDEVIGEENFVAQLVWEKGRKNDAKLFSVGHEYMLVYARSRSALKAADAVWREPKPGSREIWDKYLELRQQFAADADVQRELRSWFASLPEGSDAKKLRRYNRVDQHGPWRDRDISWPGGGGPRYDLPHPKTGRAVPIPEAGWRFSETGMQRQILAGLVEFRDTDEAPPFRKAHLRPVSAELEEAPEQEGADFGLASADQSEDRDEDANVGAAVMGSVLRSQSQVAVRSLRDLLGADLFDNPKDPAMLARLISYMSPGDGIVMDFFAGSGSTGEAVEIANRDDGGRRRFILVQAREAVRAGSLAAKQGYASIIEITELRLRKAMERLGATRGLRVFRVGKSALRRWEGVEAATIDRYQGALEGMLDPLDPETPEEHLIWEIAVAEGLSLDAKIQVLDVQNHRVWSIRDEGRNLSIHVCLSASIPGEVAEALNLKPSSILVCRDTALDDSKAINLSLRCRLKTI